MPTVSAGRRPNGNGETVGTKYVCVPVRGCRKLSMKAGSLYVIGHIDVGSWYTPKFPAGGPNTGMACQGSSEIHKMLHLWRAYLTGRFLTCIFNQLTESPSSHPEASHLL